MEIDSTGNLVTDQFLNCLVNVEQETLKKLAKLEKLKGKKLNSLAITNDLNDDISDNNYKWTSVANEPSFLVGRLIKIKY